MNKLLTGFLALPFCAALLTGCGGGSGDKQDPTIQELPVAYVKRPVPTNNNGTPISGNAFDPAAANYGAEIVIKSVASLTAAQITITAANAGYVNRRWDVKDLEFSFTGTKLLFAAKLEPVDPDNDTDYWDVYEYDLPAGVLRTLVDPTVRLVLPGHMLSPSYLQDGRIMFSSTFNWKTRDILGSQGAAFVPRAEGNANVESFNIHIGTLSRDSNGLVTGMPIISQSTFGTSHDLYPSIMHTGQYNGKVIFSRWDTKANSGNGGMVLYIMNPDGTGLDYLYGRNSHNTGTTGDTPVHFTKPRQLSNGQIVSLVRRDTGTFDGGIVVSINANSYIDNNMPIASQAGLGGNAQTTVSGSFASTRNGITNTGRFNSVYPLLDGSNRAIASYSTCYVTVMENNLPVTYYCDQPNLANPTAAPPRYGVFVYDMGGNTMSVITNPVAGIYFTDVAIAQARARPTYIADTATEVTEGILHMRNARGTYPTATQVRIYKHVYLARGVDYMFDFGASGGRQLRELIGYAPIAADGSVRVRVPANVPLAMQLVDANYQEVGPEHETWVSVRSGEERTCNGCHVAGQPHGRRDGETVANPGTTAAQTATAANGDSMNPVIDYLGYTPTTSLVTNPLCLNQADWDGNCRAFINFNDHVYPLWTSGGCVGCHTPTFDANNNGMADAGDHAPNYLDLSISTADAGEPANYDNYQHITAGRPGFDANNNAITLPRVVNPGDAAGSTLTQKLTTAPGTGETDHRSFVNSGQLKMLREWIDLGAQYRNKP